MEINKLNDNFGVVSTEAIREGRFVRLVPHSEDHNWGSLTDLPGIALPADATEARQARYLAGHAVEQRPTPFWEPQPSVGQGTQRDGWSAPVPGPHSVAVYLTPPGNQKSMTILEGKTAIAWGQGEYTLWSGDFVPNSGLVPGAYVEALNANDDGPDMAGVANLTATLADAVAIVVRYDEDAQTLSVRTFNP